MIDGVARLFGPIRQIAYIVDDVDASMQAWHRQMGVTPFVVIRHCNPFAEMTYRGKPCAGVEMSIALSMIGPVQLEFIQQHCDTPSIYREALARNHRGLHHYSFYSREFDALYRHALENGMEAVVTSGPPGMLGMAYVESTTIPGLICELVRSNDMTEGMFDRLAAHCASWDGAHWLLEQDLTFLFQTR
ncbi:MAG: VOC family protein [Candidatus Binatia bacterium]